jgi:hypothetical protein
MRRINSYVVNGTKALDLVTLANRVLPEGGASGRIERAALLAAQAEYGINSARTREKRSPLLCSTFTSASPRVLESLYANMKQLGSGCEWALVLYKMPEDASVLRAFERNVTDTLPQTRIVHMKPAPDRLQLVQRYVQTARRNPSFLRRGYDSEDPSTWIFNGVAYPKPLLFLQLLPLLSSYNRVWLLDDDISLEGFELPEFLRIWDCSFAPDPAPLITQPLLSPSSKLYPFLGEAGWKEEFKATGTRTLAAGAGFIEMQAPLMDAAFFSWFLRFLVVPMVAPLHVTGADWGFDDLFCAAADNFWRVGGVGRGGAAAKGTSATSAPCAVLVGGSTMRHLDHGALGAAIGKAPKWYLNHEMLAMVIKTFPSFFHKGFLSTVASPLNATALKRIPVGKC